MPSGVPRSDVRHLLELLESDKVAEVPIGRCSPGDAMKLSMAACFFGRAPILVLDEPTTSLDPFPRKSVQDLIAS
jgi:ABC-type multidrug transport system ATPase subunit